jgi:outer membrane protein assembly factor BamB
MNRLLLTTSLTLATVLLGHAENWANWRGPLYNSSSPEKGLPEKFSKTENIKWAAPLPGYSAATPAIHGDRVFVSSADARTSKQLALCFDRKTGKELWRAEVGENATTDRQNSNTCSPSPTTDGKRVIFFYGNGDLHAFETEGRKLWERNIGPFAFQWTFSTSPLLLDGRLYMQVLQRDVAVNGRGKPTGNESFLLAIDPQTGKDLWKHLRLSDAAAESLEAFSTPTPFTHNGRKELIIVGGDCITGHNPADGRELWRWGTWNPTKIGHWRLVPSPTVGAGVVLACAPKNAPVYAVKVGGSGTLDNKSLAWQSHVQKEEDEATAAPSPKDRDITSDVPTPLFYEGRFYLLNGTKKKLMCLDPATGRVVWSGDLGKSTFQSSPTAADGKIYVMNWDGDVFVVQAGGPEFKLLHTTNLKDEGDKFLRPSVAISQGNLFIRTGQKLYCVGK